VPTMIVSGHSYHLDAQRVEEALEGALPEPVHEHFVVINGRRWPPKQVLALVTGLDRADFTTHQARRALTRLGFPAARAGGRAGLHSQGTASPRFSPGGIPAQSQPLTEALRPFIGLWVAVRGNDILVAAPSPRDVVSWLSQHGQQAQSVFRVPDSDQAIAGAAPQ
jgi:hypothetical protein